MAAGDRKQPQRPRGYDAAPFIAAALSGLAGHPGSHAEKPEAIAARAVALGTATAEAFAAFLDKQTEG
jgi:hypothetical protein